MQRRIQVQERGRRRQLEAKEQETLFQWRDLVKNKYPGLHLMFAIPNGAFLQGDKRQRAMQWARLKRQGAKEGVHDVFLPVARCGFHGLWIEMKAPKPHGSRVSAEQLDWKAEMQGQGYRAEIAYGADEAIRIIVEYYKGAISGGNKSD